MSSAPPLVACEETPTRLRLELTGAVQGVGFRPFVYRLAGTERLAGFVRNTGDGVAIEVEGAASAVARFLARLDAEMPPHAMVFTRRMTALAALADRRFIVAPSLPGRTGAAVVLADLATCPDCLREMLDPSDRHHRYPFTSCVRCGPRYSIIEALPYDRARTTMRHFRLCPACAADYHDPDTRRFHAESIACPHCGPQLALWDAAGRVTARRQAALLDAAAALRRGMILALKGLGGFQLLVAAGDAAAVRRLRDRKQRPRKPFAVMFPSPDAVRAVACLGEIEHGLLVSPAAPIVLLRRRSDGAGLAVDIAPGNACLGAMLPATPLHHLLLRELDCPVVATSGNPGDEPIVVDEGVALNRLGGVADCFLVHDRPIRRAVDDSVVRVMAGQAVVLRRARGYAPMPLASPAMAAPVLAPVLALGGQQKAAVALGVGGQLFLGPHVGDLATARTRAAFADMISELPELHGVAPAIVACDRHPDYHSSRIAGDLGLPVTRVPHHLAHVLAGMADNGVAGPVLGVAWDGTGYGGDGTVWGGEFLAVGDGRFRRVAYLRRFRLPGGEAAVREPRRAALGLLHAIGGAAAMADRSLPPVAAFPARQRVVLATMMDRNINAPLTSSAGRLFDAVASLLGLCQTASFEGEAAMAVEFSADRARRPEPLPAVALRESEGGLMLDWQPLIGALIAARRDGIAPEPLAAGLHEGLSAAIVDVARRVGRHRVVLTGGCFQNARLTERTIARLRAAGFEPCWHHHIPPNDGGLAAGQAVFAARPLIEETPSCASPFPDRF